MTHRALGISAIVLGAVVMGMSAVAPVISGVSVVEIDIKPGSDPNSINTKSMGLVPVAILGSDTFNVTEVDFSTLRFGPANANPGNAIPAHDGHLEDVNGDGFTDLVSHYVQKEIGLSSGDIEACITGETLDGAPIFGCDSVKVK